MLSYIQRSRGRPWHHPLSQQIDLTLFKLPYSLPYRVLEQMTDIDQLTLSRMICTCVSWINDIPVARTKAEPSVAEDLLIVDTTTIRLGKTATTEDYTGYKHMKGLKFQCLVSPTREVCHVSRAYPASIHDKRVFESEFDQLATRPAGQVILGDKAYVGLTKYAVQAPIKLCDAIYKTDPEKAKVQNRMLSKQRVVVEHVFASIKKYQILRYANYFSREWIAKIFYAICILHNLSL